MCVLHLVLDWALGIIGPDLRSVPSYFSRSISSDLRLAGTRRVLPISRKDRRVTLWFLVFLSVLQGVTELFPGQPVSAIRCSFPV